jgi:hypothetical protein
VDRAGPGYPALVNAAELLRMNVSDVLRMELGDLMTVDLTGRSSSRRTRRPTPAVLRFELEPGAPAHARGFTRGVVRGWADRRLVDELAVERAELVVSEFVTQSLHANSGGTVVLCLTDSIHVEITADRADFDAADHASLGAQVVDALSTSWGVSYTWPHFRALWSDVAA